MTLSNRTLSPLKPKKEIICEFSTLDIENRRNGEVLYIDLYDGVKHYGFDDWESAWNYIESCTLRGDGRFSQLYAHNGGGWDWLSLIQYLLSLGNKYNISAIPVGSRIISVTITLGTGQRITLLDSFCLFFASLDDVAKKLIGKGKVEYDKKQYPHVEYLFNADRNKAIQYTEGDSQSLYDSLHRFAQLVHDDISPIGRLGITLASTALRVFRTMLRNPITTPSNPKLKTLLREGYQGGRVECFKPGYYPEIHVYDINSLYPSVMRRIKVPTTYKGAWVNNFNPDETGVYRIKWEQHNKSIPAIFVQKGRGVYRGEGVFYTPEIHYAMQNGCSVTILEGYEFAESAVIFGEYVDKLYTLRMTDKDGPLGHACKLLLNSLYGKFGQKPERRKIVRACSFEDIERLHAQYEAIEELNPEKGLFYAYETIEFSYEHVGIAGCITSTARVVLHSKFNNGTVYCDTDSVHTYNPITFHLGPNLGQFKHEFTGEGIYAGKKLYGLRSGEKEKLRVKGVRVATKEKVMGAALSFDDLRTLIDGKQVECEFESAPTPIEVFKGKQSCRMTKRKRTIKRTA